MTERGRRGAAAEEVVVSERAPEQPEGGAAPGWSAPGAPPPAWGAPPPSSGQPPAYGQPPTYGAPPAYGQAPPAWGAPPGWGGPVPGAPQPGVVPLRPLGLGELLDGSVAVVRRYPRPTLGISVVVAVVTTLLGIGLLSLLPRGALSTATTVDGFDGAQLGAVVAGGSGTLVITALAGIVLSGIITVVVGKAVLGQPLTTAEAWHAVRPLVPRLVLLAVVTGLLVAVSAVGGVLLAALAYAVAGAPSLVLGIPLGIAGLVGAVYVYIRLALAAPAMVLEKVRLREALRRSGVLTRRSWWRVLGVLVLAAVIAGVVGQVLQLPFAAAGGAGSVFTVGAEVSLRALVLAQIGTGLAQVLTGPFNSGVRALLYIDRRMRAEGLDVALAAASARG